MGSSDTVTVLGVVCVREPRATGGGVFIGRLGEHRIVVLDLVGSWSVSVDRAGLGKRAEGRGPTLFDAAESCLESLLFGAAADAALIECAQSQRAQPMRRVA
jgi:hypothetical protein